MIVLCPKCKAKLEIPEDKAKKLELKLRCPGCSLKFPLAKAARAGAAKVAADATSAAASPGAAAPRSRPLSPRPAAAAPPAAADDGRMPGQAVIGGVVAAVIGAVTWGALVAFLDREIGYVAWGIGVLVGAGVRQGLRDDETAVVLCATLAAASISRAR